MSTTYSDCPPEVSRTADSILLSIASELIDAGVTVAYYFAANENGPALNHNGWPAKAMVKITSLKDRVSGLSDARIWIDEQTWHDSDDIERQSLLAHELEHLELVRKKQDGSVKRDDCGRPVLKIRKHDFQIGGFHSIVRRYGSAAHEAMALVEVRQVWVQSEFTFGEEPDTIPIKESA